ncbi:MAG: hypothetical protein HRF43_19100 [Phycisphaerae bacterium]|jgi:hypothetical protein
MDEREWATESFENALESKEDQATVGGTGEPPVFAVVGGFTCSIRSVKAVG